MRLSAMMQALRTRIEAIDVTPYTQGLAMASLREVVLDRENEAPQFEHLTYMVGWEERRYGDRRRGYVLTSTEGQALLFFRVRPALGGTRSTDEDLSSDAAEDMVSALSYGVPQASDGWWSVVDFVRALGEESDEGIVGFEVQFTAYAWHTV